MTTTHTVPQPFMRINTPAACGETSVHAPQVVPVLGNSERRTPVFVVLHGRGHLTATGEVTTTPVWLTWAEAERAEQLHADDVRLARDVEAGLVCGYHDRPVPCIECRA